MRSPSNPEAACCRLWWELDVEDVVRQDECSSSSELAALGQVCDWALGTRGESNCTGNGYSKARAIFWGVIQGQMAKAVVLWHLQLWSVTVGEL